MFIRKTFESTKKIEIQKPLTPGCYINNFINFIIILRCFLNILKILKIYLGKLQGRSSNYDRYYFKLTSK